MTPNDVFDEIAFDIARVMAGLVYKYRRHEPELANALCDSLGTLISISAKDPAIAMLRISERLRHFDWQTVKTAHFGHKLGVAEPKVLNFGTFKEKPE